MNYTNDIKIYSIKWITPLTRMDTNNLPPWGESVEFYYNKWISGMIRNGNKWIWGVESESKSEIEV